MSVILNETEWAKSAIENNRLGRKPYDTLRRVARYYIDQGNKPEQVRRMLDAFLLSCDPSASLSKWSDTIDAALNKAKKNAAIQIDSINITKPEMAIISSIDGRQAQRLAFTLLCLARYQQCINPNTNGWVALKDSEIMSMANIKNSIRRQSAIYNMLRENGLVEFSKRVDNVNVRVTFMTEGEVALSITDFRNLGYQLNMYNGEPLYMQCKMCGLTIKKTGRTQKYCKECAVIAQNQNIAKYARKKGIPKIA